MLVNLTDNIDKPLVDATEVSKVLLTCPETVLRLACANRIPSIRLGHRIVRFVVSDVLDALRGRASATPAGPMTPEVRAGG